MSAYLDRLFDEYRRAAKAGQDVMDAAAAENRDLSPEETETRDKAFADVTRLKGEIENVQNFEDLRKAGDAFREAAAPIVEKSTGAKKSDGDILRSMLRGDIDHADFAPSGRVRNQHPDIELRALGTSVDVSVAKSYADFVTVYERTNTPMLRPDIVTLLERGDGSPLVLPQVTADASVAGTLTAENTGGITEGDPTLAAVTLNPYKYGLTNLFSRELADDNFIDIENLLAETTGRSMGIAIGGQLTTADGSSKPNGVVNAAANGGTATGTGATFGTHFGPTDLISLFYKPAAPNRDNGSWMMNATSLAAARSMRDVNGQLIWQASYQLGQPELLLGRPVYENPGLASGSAAKAVLFGNFKKFFVVRVVPIRVESSIHYKFSTDQVAIRTIERVDSDLLDAGAIYYLVNAAV